MIDETPEQDDPDGGLDPEVDSREFDEIDSEIADDGGDKLQETIDDLSQRVEIIEQQLEGVDEDALPSVFPATVSTDGTWQEICVIAGTGNSFTNGVRLCNDSTNMAQAITLAAGDSILLQVKTSLGTKYIIVNGAGGGTVTLATITGHTGAGPLDFNPYQGTFPDSSTANLYNGFEPFGGSPGTLGVDVGTDGSLTGTTCFGQPIGGATVIVVWDANNTRWAFSAPNSFQ